MSSYYSRKNTETKCDQGEAPPIIYTLLAGGGGAFLSPALRCLARPDGNRGALSRIMAFTSLPSVFALSSGRRGKLFTAAPPGPEKGKLYLNVRVCGRHLWLNRNYAPAARGVPN